MLVGMIGVLVGHASGGAVTADHPDVLDQVPGQCEVGYGEASVDHRDHGGHVGTIDVLVVVDRADPGEVRRVMERVEDVYSSIGVPLAVRYLARDFSTDSPPRIIEQAKRVVVKTEADAVLVESGVDLTGAGPLLSGNGVAGQADCLGGVKHRKGGRSIAVAEVGFGRRTMPDEDAAIQLERDALVAAHELGHLFGARHEHGNCVEALTADDLGNGYSFARPCTLMGGVAGRQELRFGSIEAAIIRGHVRHYAQP